MLNPTLLIVGILSLTAGPSAAVEVGRIDAAHSSVAFRIKHMGISTVPGRFSVFRGTITLEKEESTAAKVEVEIEAASIDTGVEGRDKHLRGPDFFDVQRFPLIRFTSTKVTKRVKDRFKLTGDLTMHGVTKPVTLDVTFGGSAKDPKGGRRGAFSASGKLNRKDFGIVWNKTLDSGGLLIGEEVALVIDIEAFQAGPGKD
ncbi:MAG TPA: hypothetical protein DCM05_07265 [Elusimicrobia bacterium]|nr:hypothetical protein [Elusimicrobiota bacterium]